MLTDKR